jgi:hypothetical protein
VGIAELFCKSAMSGRWDGIRVLYFGIALAHLTATSGFAVTPIAATFAHYSHKTALSAMVKMTSGVKPGFGSTSANLQSASLIRETGPLCQASPTIAN